MHVEQFLGREIGSGVTWVALAVKRHRHPPENNLLINPSHQSEEGGLTRASKTDCDSNGKAKQNPTCARKAATVENESRYQSRPQSPAHPAPSSSASSEQPADVEVTKAMPGN